MKRITTRHEFFTYPTGGICIWLMLHFFKDQYWTGFAFFVASLIALPIVVLQSEEIYIDDDGLCIRKTLNKKVEKIEWKQIKSYQIKPDRWKQKSLGFKSIHIELLNGRTLTIDERWVNQMEKIEELVKIAIENQTDETV